MKMSYTEKAKTLGTTLGFSTGLYALSKIFTKAVPMISSGVFGGMYAYDLVRDFNNKALTNKETAILILKKATQTAVNYAAGIGGFYAGFQIGILLGVASNPGTLCIAFACGGLAGYVGGWIEKYLLGSEKMELRCNSFYQNYIPLKFREEGNIPDLFWKNVNKDTKSFVLELIIDQKYKTWSVINIPPKERKISPGIGETLIKYEEFGQLNPNTADFMLFSLKKEKITKEEWNDQEKNKELIIDVAILEVSNL